MLAFLGFFALGALPVLLSLTMFISVLLTLTRGWRDSEMVIWFASGLPLTAWLKPVMLFALPQIAVIAALSLFISPWAAQMARAVRDASSRRATTSRASRRACSARPPTRSACSSSNRCRATTNAGAERVRQPRCSSGKSGVSMSRSGRTETAPNGDRFIVLEQGRRYEGAPGDEQYRVTEFDRYAARIETRESKEPRAQRRRTCRPGR